MTLLFVLCLLPALALAQEEAKLYATMFRNADIDHDQGLSKTEVKKAFDKYEADKKEGISYDEYFQYVHSRNPGLDYSLKILFQIFDGDHDGVLKQYDFNVMHEDMDRDWNGIVDMEEFKAWDVRVFKGVDKSLRRMFI